MHAAINQARELELSENPTGTSKGLSSTAPATGEAHVKSQAVLSAVEKNRIPVGSSEQQPLTPRGVQHQVIDPSILVL